MVPLAVGIIAIVLFAVGMRWYLKRAMHVSSENDARYGLRRKLYLSLQDIRDAADDELATNLDALIDIVRYDTPASNELTIDLDNQLTEEVQKLSSNPSMTAAETLKAKLIDRNRRARL